VPGFALRQVSNFSAGDRDGWIRDWGRGLRRSVGRPQCGGPSRTRARFPPSRARSSRKSRKAPGAVRSPTVPGKGAEIADSFAARGSAWLRFGPDGREASPRPRLSPRRVNLGGDVELASQLARTRAVGRPHAPARRLRVPVGRRPGAVVARRYSYGQEEEHQERQRGSRVTSPGSRSVRVGTVFEHLEARRSSR
jgi:hypothetical protein